MVEQMVCVVCRHCGSEHIVRNGSTRNGKQRYLCHSCGRTSRDHPQAPGYSEEHKEMILRAYQERSSLRGLERTFGVSRATISAWLKKDQRLRANQHPQRALVATLLPAQDEDVLELDELWSFVGNKANRVWIWIALCRRTRQVVAWMWGDRSKYTCESLWAKIPVQYRNCPCFTDGCEAYGCVVPPEQLHQQEKKGPTNHLECFNLTLRQRLARFTRKTLAFSKNLFMHIVSLRLFFLRYNSEQARNYNASLRT